MSSETQSTALATVEKQTGEIQVSAQMAMARHEIEGALTIAQRMPRNEDAAFGKIAKACGRFAFAESALYSYPRGGTQIEGASVDLARLMARCWGNIRSGLDIVQDDDGTRTVRGWAWDLESNTKETQDATFRKLVQRKVWKDGSSATQWVKPDERDLRELTNKQGAIAVRNCLLHLMPPDFIEEAKRMVKETVHKGISENTDDHRRKIIRGFGGLGVRPEDLETYLGHSLAQATPNEIDNLRKIWKSISDGNSIWSEYVEKKPDAKPATDDLTPKTKPPADDKTTAPEKPTEPERTWGPEDQQQYLNEYTETIAAASTITDVQVLADHASKNTSLSPETQLTVAKWCDERLACIRATRGKKK